MELGASRRIDDPFKRALGDPTVAGSAVPGVGEAIDVGILVHPNSRPVDRLFAAASLGVNLVTGGLAPNFGAAGRVFFRGSDELIMDVGDGIRRVGGQFDEVVQAVPNKPVNKGIYEFPDQKAGNKPYVGQSDDVPRRLGQHESAGRLTPGTETTTPVPGGRTAREIAEHQRIQQLTGGQKAKNSPAVSNQRDPIGPNRRPGAGLLEPRD